MASAHLAAALNAACIAGVPAAVSNSGSRQSSISAVSIVAYRTTFAEAGQLWRVFVMNSSKVWQCWSLILSCVLCFFLMTCSAAHSASAI